MSDPRINKLAKLLVNYSTEVQEDDLVAIIALPNATPLVKEIYREVLSCKAHPYVLPTAGHIISGFEDFEYIFFKEASEKQLKHINLFAKMITEEFDVRIVIKSEENTHILSNIEPERISMRSDIYSELIKISLKRSASGEFRWMFTNYPTQAYAQDADMSLEEYSNFLFKSTFCDTDDPVSEWKNIHKQQQAFVDWLKGKEEVQIKGPNADLTLSIKDRVFINAAGKVNMPCGEIYTGPVEGSANGWLHFTYPAIYRGKEVDGIKLEFEKGKVVSASAKKNNDYLQTMIDTDEGSRYIGEFAFGTNMGITDFIKNTLFDEKIGGTIHIALGAGYPETGSKNESAIHWDMICDMRNGGQVFVDGELFYESGEFMI